MGSLEDFRILATTIGGVLLAENQTKTFTILSAEKDSVRVCSVSGKDGSAFSNHESQFKGVLLLVTDMVRAPGQPSVLLRAAYLVFRRSDFRARAKWRVTVGC